MESEIYDELLSTEDFEQDQYAFE